MQLTPHNFPELFYKTNINGKDSPGKATIESHDRTKKWDIQSAKGKTGATAKLNGDDPAQFGVSYDLSDQEDENGESDITRWPDYQKLIESSTSGPTPVALLIYHPDLLAQHITEVTNGGVGGKVWDSKGGCTIKVKFVEYKPAKNVAVSSAKAKPKDSDTNGTGTRHPIDPNEDAKDRLAALVEQAKAP